MCVDLWLKAKTPAETNAAISTAILARPHVILWSDGSGVYRADADSNRVEVLHMALGTGPDDSGIVH